MANLQKGIRKSEERAQEQRSAGFYRVKTAVMKDGEGPWYYRIVTDLDEMVGADTHMFCDTKPKPEEFKGDNWPSAMPCICMNDRMFRIPDADGRPTDAFEEGYGNCHIHNRDRGKIRDGKYKRDKSVPDNQTYALAVAREPILDERTKRPTGFRDYTDEFKLPDGTVKKVPRFVIISQKYRNFWSALEASIFMGNAPVGAYDFKVSRKENDYIFSPTVADPVLYPGSEAWKRYAEALELVGFDLDEEILRMGSQDWYDRWFVEGAVPKDGYGRSGDDAAAEEDPAAGPAPEQASDEEVDVFRDQLKAARSTAPASA
jgi:hypothetical protein